MQLPQWLTFFQRRFPSANSILIHSQRPTLIDSGFGSDLAATEHLLREAGVGAENLQLIVNTHYHSDHSGGNSGLQRKFGVAIGAHRWEADLVNRRDRAAGGAEWLDQPIEAYQVDLLLSDGDVIDAGEIQLQVIHTPGHTLGHICLYEPESQILMGGDLLHKGDVAWVNPFQEGVGAVQRIMESLDRLLSLPIQVVLPGHGLLIYDVEMAIDRALGRYERWLDEPEKMAWHAMKRIFAYALMLLDGLPEKEVGPYLLKCPWFRDYSQQYFDTDPSAMIAPLIDEMLRSGAAAWVNGRLIAQTPYNAPSKDWLSGKSRPKYWPAVKVKAL
jgi:hydroxyacylglutathione hydrolase